MRATLPALLIALVFASACKKQPRGDLPPPPGTMGGSGGAAATAPQAQAGQGGQAGDTGHGSVPAQTAPHTPEKLPDGRLAMGPFSLQAPASWTVKPVTSSMRAADFVLSEEAGAEAELVVTHFGNRGAGSVEENLDRWIGQIQQPDGKPSRDAAKIEKTQYAGQEATLLTLGGRYVTGGMPGGSGPADRANQLMLAAIVNSPQGPYYFKLVGARATVEANAEAFRTMLGSLKLR